MSDVQTRVAAIVGHLPDADEIASILADEIIGSPLDILDAVGHLLGDDAEQLAATLAPIFCESTSAKRPRIAPLPDNGNGGPSALDKLSWRREYMSHEQRFVLPYNHAIEKQTLVLEQTAFGPEGFASTIWDSAIVLARYLEHRQSSSCQSCVELGAGCGLPGIVLHALGAKAVLLTDLEDNLPLLQRNMDANCSHDGRARVEALRWGGPLPAQIECGAPYDLIVATDVLYVLEAVVPLVETLVALSNEKTEILIAAGRNRQHGDDFFAAAARRFKVVAIAASELHPTYQCTDVGVWRLTLLDGPPPLGNLAGSSSSGGDDKSLTIDGVRYNVCAGGALRRLLADGTPGPIVGRMGRDGGVLLDEAHYGGEWVEELLTATLPPPPLFSNPAPPAEVVATVAHGCAGEWRDAIEPSLLSACRKELAALDASGRLARKNHSQQVTTRADRIAFLALDGGAEAEPAVAFEDDDDDDADGDEHAPCPPALRRVFALLERIGSSLSDAVGVRSLLTPRLGMVATYDAAPVGYVRHLDNERDPAVSAVTHAASGYRNFRALTAIAYLNEPDWKEEDGGTLLCYPPVGEDGQEASLRVVPRGGTIVVFDSRRVPHEVLPARRPRSAATLWMVTSDLLQPNAVVEPSRGGRKLEEAVTGGGSSAASASWESKLESTPDAGGFAFNFG